MDLAGELGAERGPIALEDGLEIVVLTPVLRDGVIDDAGAFIEDRCGVAIGADGPVDSLPDVKLLSASAVIAEGKLISVDLFIGDECAAQIVAHGGLGDPLVRALEVEGVLVVVKADVGEGVEVDGVGTSHPRAVEEIGIEHL